MIRTIVAKPADASSVTLAPYRSGETDIIANYNEGGIVDPFATAETASTLAAASDNRVEFSEVAGELMLVGACEHCAAELYTTEECASALADEAMASTDNDHMTAVACPHCSETANVDIAGLMDETLRETASGQQQQEEAAQETEQEAAQQEAEEAAEQEQQEEAAQETEQEAAEQQEEASQEDGEEVTASAVEQEVEQEAAQEAAQEVEQEAAEQDQQEEHGEQQEEQDDDDGEQQQQQQEDDKEEASAGSTEDIINRLFSETAAAEGQDAETETNDVENSVITYEVASAIQFDPKTARVVPLRPGVMVAFVNDGEGVPVNIGTLHLEHASVQNGKFFTEVTAKSLTTLNNAFTTCLASGENLGAFGFIPVVHEIAVTDAVEALVAEQAETAHAEVASASDSYKAEFQQAIATAMAGMHKGIFENPLHDALTAALETRRVSGADRVVSTVLAATLGDFVKHVLAKADELMGKDAGARAEIASVIKSAKVRTSSSKAEEHSEFADLSTAALVGIDQPAVEDTRPAATKKPAAAPKRLFSQFAALR